MKKTKTTYTHTPESVLSKSEVTKKPRRKTSRSRLTDKHRRKTLTCREQPKNPEQKKKKMLRGEKFSFQLTQDQNTYRTELSARLRFPSWSQAFPHFCFLSVPGLFPGIQLTRMFGGSWGISRLCLIICHIRLSHDEHRRAWGSA